MSDSKKKHGLIEEVFETVLFQLSLSRSVGGPGFPSGSRHDFSEGRHRACSGRKRLHSVHVALLGNAGGRQASAAVDHARD